jgi:hypothetical protein
MIDCPIYHFSSVEKLFKVEMCGVCPAGYDCNVTGISDYEAYPSEPGYYCNPNSVSVDKTPLLTHDVTPCKKCP